MIELFVTELREFWNWLLQNGLRIAWPLVGILALALAARLGALRLDALRPLSEPKESEAGRLSAWTHAVGKGLLLVGWVAILSTVLGAGMRSVGQYRAKRDVQRFDSQSVVSGAAIDQAMPQAALVLERKQTLSRNVQASAELLANPRDLEAWGSVLEGIGYPSAEIVNVRPIGPSMATVSFRIANTVTSTVTVERGTVDLTLEPISDADPRGNAYRLRFEGEYSWRNPTDQPQTSRFAFGIPDHGGTVSDISVVVGGVAVSSPDESGLFRGESRLAPGQTITAKVRYTTEGRGNLRLYPGTGLRAIPNLTVRLTSRAPVFFERGSLRPNRREGDASVWELRNTVTRQIISIAVPAQRNDREVWWKLGYLVPVAMLLFVALLIGLGELHRTWFELLSLATIQFAGLAVPVMVAERSVPPTLLGWIGAVVAVSACGWLGGRRLAAVSALSALACLAGAMGPLTAPALWLTVIGSLVWIARARRTP